ncbi:hypothetical protein DAPPUDRAFT_324678 [Daphnia pulex]|uniref:Uncharacterized protein n=1 Tax=Daphnia pulex TaxID=6669 RepID=E9H2F1_DAPPU|nr:hypothetical protein DAPPUDRAFT_324678 [Daphnia pulex]|eukprot:EFX74081.1 hypothetical protein DAPPUDRAFT_324678 [Daphnia pulex]
MHQFQFKRYFVIVAHLDDLIWYFYSSQMFLIHPMILESLSTEKLSTYVGDLMQLLYSREFLKTHKMTNQVGGQNGNTVKLVINQLELAQIIKAVLDNFITMPKKSDITSHHGEIQQYIKEE